MIAGRRESNKIKRGLKVVEFKCLISVTFSSVPRLPDETKKNVGAYLNETERANANTWRMQNGQVCSPRNKFYR